jgi:hypothetical protein
MQDERLTPDMPVLDRQGVPVRHDAAGGAVTPGRVPETKPTPLQGAFIHLSLGLICGTIAITALNPVPSSTIRSCASCLGGLVLVLVTADAARIWRSAFAWLVVIVVGSSGSPSRRRLPRDVPR